MGLSLIVIRDFNIF